MISRLSTLQDRTARIANYVGDHLHLQFQPDASLSIFNTVLLTGPVTENLEAINGKRLLSVGEDGVSAILRFEGGSVIQIDLQAGAYNGPEAMVLRVPGEPIVVWT